MSPRRLHPDNTFRTALEAQDFPRAEAALKDYITWLRSEPRTAEEIKSAMNLFEWGIGAASERKVQIAEELMRLKSFFEAYLPGRCTETWHIVG